MTVITHSSQQEMVRQEFHLLHVPVLLNTRRVSESVLDIWQYARVSETESLVQYFLREPVQ